MAGRFIVLEGVDSEVLADQAGDLGNWLRGEGLVADVTREPTDGPFGAQLRLVLSGRLKVDEFTKAALFMTDRMDHLHRAGGVLEDLARGVYVLGIRYLLSTYAYQCREVQAAAERRFGADAPLDALQWLRDINQLCPWPDRVIFIDSTVESCLQRIREREGAEVAADPALQSQYERDRAAYHAAIARCRAWGHEVLVIDGNQPGASIHRLCREAIIALGLEH